VRLIAQVSVSFSVLAVSVVLIPSPGASYVST